MSVGGFFSSFFKSQLYFFTPATPRKCKRLVLLNKQRRGQIFRGDVKVWRCQDCYLSRPPLRLLPPVALKPAPEILRLLRPLSKAIDGCVQGGTAAFIWVEVSIFFFWRGQTRPPTILFSCRRGKEECMCHYQPG